MKSHIKLVIGLTASAMAFIVITAVALEGNEVALLYTRSAVGERATRVWVADHDGVPWIEAASADREFYRDILIDPRVELERNGERAAYRAVAYPDERGRRLVRRLLRTKYGWADVWIGLLADTSSSIALRLVERS